MARLSKVESDSGDAATVNLSVRPARVSKDLSNHAPYQRWYAFKHILIEVWVAGIFCNGAENSDEALQKGSMHWDERCMGGKYNAHGTYQDLLDHCKTNEDPYSHFIK